MALINLFVYLGVIAFGISGALIGIKKQLDLFGIISLAVATSLGGGIIRDIVIGNVPPVAFIKPQYALVSVISVLLALAFYHNINKLTNVIMISDAIGLGVFTAVGAHTAVLHTIEAPFLIMSMGLVTGVGGGILRDVFAKEIPFVFRKEVYAIASILGSLSFILTYEILPHVISLYLCLAVTFTVRVLSVVYKLNVPFFKEETRTFGKM